MTPAASPERVQPRNPHAACLPSLPPSPAVPPRLAASAATRVLQEPCATEMQRQWMHASIPLGALKMKLEAPVGLCGGRLELKVVVSMLPLDKSGGGRLCTGWLRPSGRERLRAARSPFEDSPGTRACARSGNLSSGRGARQPRVLANCEGFAAAMAHQHTLLCWRCKVCDCMKVWMGVRPHWGIYIYIYIYLYTHTFLHTHPPFRPPPNLITAPASTPAPAPAPLRSTASARLQHKRALAPHPPTRAGGAGDPSSPECSRSASGAVALGVGNVGRGGGGCARWNQALPAFCLMPV
eukprot:355732-Chlamydomonas_euryale.AAC.3